MGNEIRIGDLLTLSNENKVYRIIYVSTDVVIGCLLGINILKFRQFSTNDLLEKISVGLITLENVEHIVINTNEMSSEDAAIFNRNKSMFREIDDIYGPTYELLEGNRHKAELRKICDKYGINRETMRRLYVRYIQAGLDDIALVDKRSRLIPKEKRGNYNYKQRPGKKANDEFSSQIYITDDVRKQFDEAIKERKSGRCKTYESAYSWLVNKYYSETYMDNGNLVIRHKNESQIPSKRQFTYYVQKHTSKREMDIIKTSVEEVRNDKRLLLGDTYSDALGPGDLVEIDAVEVDVALVSEVDHKQAIGSPIMYLMIDVFTRMILAMAVSLHNNAMIALTNLFLNLSDDKYEFCMKYGHEINNTAWISNIIPRRIRVDRGSDFKSDQFAHICEELGIDRQLVPGATGSLKGNIEQEFRTLHAAQKPHLDGNGVITKRYDSNHHEQAVLTIEEYTKMAVDFVLHHNVMAASEYPLTADMVKNNVHAVPAELWVYGCQKYGAPRPISNIDMFRYSLMIPAKASLDRSGITYKELSYLNGNDPVLFNRMYELQNKREKMDIRIDPRDITNIYYLRDGKLMMASLNPLKMANDGYLGMTLFEYESFLKEKKRIRKEDEARTQRVKNSLHSAQDMIVQEAVSNKTKDPVSTKNIRETRNIEKQRVANRNSIASRLDSENLIEETAKPEIFAKVIPVPALPDNGTEKKGKTAPKDIDFSGLNGFKAAMKMFEEGG